MKCAEFSAANVVHKNTDVESIKALVEEFFELLSRLFCRKLAVVEDNDPSGDVVLLTNL